jgi:hypothetical protein
VVSALAEEVLSATASEEEGEAFQVGTEDVQAAGGVADVSQERWRQPGRVCGEPVGDELQELGEFSAYLR